MLNVEERQELYLLAAALFRYPTAGLVEAMKNLDQDSLSQEFVALPVLSREALSDLGELQAQFTWLFLNRPGGVTSPLYGSLYLEPDNQVMGITTRRVEEAYRNEGLVLEKDGEPADSLPAELEFMAHLCGREAEAVQQNDMDKVAACRSRQKQFFQRECGSWGLDFCDKLLKAEPGLFYSWCGQLLASFLNQEKTTMMVE